MDATRIYLNNSNTKWLLVGVSLEKPKFYVDVLLQGEKCRTIKLGIDGLKCLTTELAQHDYFMKEYGVSSNLQTNYISNLHYFFLYFQSHVPTTTQNVISTEKVTIQGNHVFKITMKTDPTASIYLGMVSIERLLEMQKWITEIIHMKNPEIVQKMWDSLVVNIANNKSELPSVGGNVLAATAEFRCNFSALLNLDITNCGPAIFQQEEEEERDV